MIDNKILTFNCDINSKFWHCSKAVHHSCWPALEAFYVWRKHWKNIQLTSRIKYFSMLSKWKSRIKNIFFSSSVVDIERAFSWTYKAHIFFYEIQGSHLELHYWPKLHSLFKICRNQKVLLLIQNKVQAWSFLCQNNNNKSCAYKDVMLMALIDYHDEDPQNQTCMINNPKCMYAVWSSSTYLYDSKYRVPWKQFTYHQKW